MNKTQAQRLLNVATACREMKEPNKFDMKRCGYTNGCSTPACALGNYAFRRDLQKTFKLDIHGDLVDNNDEYVYIVRHENEEVPDHFGITLDESLKLFGKNGCNRALTHIQAAKYIEKFLDEHDWAIAA